MICQLQEAKRWDHPQGEEEVDHGLKEDSHELQKGPITVLCVAEHGPPGLDVDREKEPRPGQRWSEGIELAPRLYPPDAMLPYRGVTSATQRGSSFSASNVGSTCNAVNGSLKGRRSTR